MFHFHRRNMYYENENSTNGTSADLGFVLSQSWDRHVTRGTFQSCFVTSSIHFLVEPGSCRKIFVGHPKDHQNDQRSHGLGVLCYARGAEFLDPEFLVLFFWKVVKVWFFHLLLFGKRRNFRQFLVIHRK